MRRLWARSKEVIVRFIRFAFIQPIITSGKAQHRYEIACRFLVYVHDLIKAGKWAFGGRETAFLF
jgi:hypothetical protein